MKSRTIWITILSAFFTALSAFARPVDVTVLVLNPQDGPIPDAIVRVGAGVPPWSFPSARTNEQGEATITIEVADLPVSRIRAFVVDAPGPQVPDVDFIDEMSARMEVRQFDPLGYSTTLLLTDDVVTLVAKASTAQMANGQLVGPGAASVSVVNLLADLPQRADIASGGQFSLPVPMGRRFDLFVQMGDLVLIHSVGPLAPADSMPQTNIDSPASLGRFTGTVMGMEDFGEPYLALSAVRVDGGATFPLIVRTNGRFDNNQNGTLDPTDVNQDFSLLPGEYYIIADDNPLLNSLSLIHAIRTTSAQQERDLLVRMTITSDQRTVVAWDATTLVSTTEALVRAVLFAP